jgi:hypothetical protein
LQAENGVFTTHFIPKNTIIPYMGLSYDPSNVELPEGVDRTSSNDEHTLKISGREYISGDHELVRFFHLPKNINMPAMLNYPNVGEKPTVEFKGGKNHYVTSLDMAPNKEVLGRYGSQFHSTTQRKQGTFTQPIADERPYVPFSPTPYTSFKMTPYYIKCQWDPSDKRINYACVWAQLEGKEGGVFVKPKTSISKDTLLPILGLSYSVDVLPPQIDGKEERGVYEGDGQERLNTNTEVLARFRLPKDMALMSKVRRAPEGKKGNVKRMGYAYITLETIKTGTELLSLD